MLGLREPPGCPGQEEIVIAEYDDGSDYMLDAIVRDFAGLVIRKRFADGREILYYYNLIKTAPELEKVE